MTAEFKAVQPVASAAQLGPAVALVALLKEYPGLPPATWDIDPHIGELRGTLGRQDTFDNLRAYADVLDGRITPDRRDFQSQVDGAMLRTHRLRTVWRDVRVTVSLYRPAPLVMGGAA